MSEASVIQAALVAALVAGPIICGILAWLVGNERLRNAIILLAAVSTGAMGLALAKSGAFSLETGPAMGYLGTILEFLVVFLVVAIAYKNRLWLVLGMGLAQGALAVYELFSSHHAENPVFVFDSLALILVLIVTLVGSLILVFGMGYMHRHEHHAPPTAASTGRFFFFLIGFLGLMNGLVMTDSLKWLSIFWEGTTLCSFFLIGHDRTEEARKNASRALLINTFGGLALMLGAVISTHQGGNGNISGLIQSAALLPIVLVLIAAFTKSAQLPFQSWLLGAMVAPTPVSALLHSSTMVKAGSYLVLRLAPAFENTPLAMIVAIAGAFTFCVASGIAISQSNAKKVLAYSTIANLGLIVACSGINSPLAYAAALIILIYHAISKALLFLCVGTIEQQIGSRNIDDMSGIMFKMPMTTTIAIVGMVSMMAPPFGMLIGKWMAIASAGHTPLVLLPLVLGSALTICFWAKWMGRITTTAYHERYVIEQLPRSIKSVLIILVVAVIVSAAASMSVYKVWLRPLATEMLAHVSLQPDSGLLLRSVDEYMEWAIYPIFAVVALVVLASMSGFRKSHVRLPFLCGENAGDAGAKTFEFRSLMDQRVMAQVTSYYFAPWFGESGITQWANPVAILILLSLFARIGLL